MNQYLDPEWWQQSGLDLYEKLLGWFTSPQFYAQIGAIAGCVIAAWFIARLLKRRIKWFSDEPAQDAPWFRIRQYVFALSDLLFPLLCYILLGFAVDMVQSTVGASWLVKIARGASVMFPPLQRHQPVHQTSHIAQGAFVYRYSRRDFAGFRVSG